MEFKVVELSHLSRRKLSDPFVSILKANGMFSFSASVSNFLDDNYSYLQFMTAEEDGKTVIAVKLLKDEAENSLKIQHTKNSSGFSVYSSGMCNKYFIDDFKDDAKRVSFPVKKLDDTTLIIVR